jgi:hypothetical protein
MSSITAEEFEELLRDIRLGAVHLETRDAYGTAVELPHMAQWQAGEPDDLAWLQGWCATVRGHVTAGRTIRRARVVSEPLSEYQRWSHSIANPMVDAGEDIRWVPRRRVSSIGIPGNDYYLVDDRIVIFLHYAGDGLATDRTVSTDPDDLTLCRTAFEAAWKVSTPHRDYRPQ